MAAFGESVGEFTENAEKMQLGVFQRDACVSNAEVALLLQRDLDEMRSAGKEPHETFSRTLEYATDVSPLPATEDMLSIVTSLRQKLEELRFTRRDVDGNEDEVKLEQFEIASLCNLVPEDDNEMCTLIGLGRFHEGEREEILAILREHIPSAMGTA